MPPLQSGEEPQDTQESSTSSADATGAKAEPDPSPATPSPSPGADSEPNDKKKAPRNSGRREPRLVKRSVVGVGFCIGDVPHDYDNIGLKLAYGDRVLIETGRDPRPATVLVSPRVKEVDPRRLRRVIRRVGEVDKRPAREDSLTIEARSFFLRRVRELKLPMKLVRVELGTGNSRCSFFFASEERVDFRELVRDLSRHLQMRIEMRQVGVRDEAREVGGLGVCGRELCCCSWIHRFAPVSIRMAKDQGLALNPQKVSGACGRLLCCLTYEQSTYKELRSGLPKMGKRVITPMGEGRVRDIDVLKGKVRVQLQSGIKEFDREELSRPCPGGPCGAHGPGAGAEARSTGRPSSGDSRRARRAEAPHPPAPGDDSSRGSTGAEERAPGTEGDNKPARRRRSRRRRRSGGRGDGAESTARSSSPAPSIEPGAAGGTDQAPRDEAEGAAPAKRRPRRRRRRRKPGGGGGGGSGPEGGSGPGAPSS